MANILSPKYSYIIVPHTREWGVELPYTMRLFSKANLKVEALPELHCKVFEGEWTVDNGSSIGNISTAGGPLKLKSASAAVGRQSGLRKPVWASAVVQTGSMSR